jgi:hypothetical protein
MKCDHWGGDKFKTIVAIPDYNGMGTELVLRQCDYCKAFSVKLTERCGPDFSIRVFETKGWSTVE